MPFIAAPNTLQIQMCFTVASQECQNVYHVTRTGAVDETMLDGLNGIMETWWTDHLKAWLSPNVTFRKDIITDISVSNGLSKEYSMLTGNVGTSSDDPFPNNVTLAVKWGTGFAGRSYRGRTYHIQILRTSVNGNTVIPTALASLSGVYAQLMGELVAAGFPPVVVSKYHNLLPRTTAVVTPITGMSIDPTVDSQRRRLPGRGR